MPQLRKTVKTFRRYIYGLLVSALITFVTFLPEKLSQILANWLGWGMYHVSRRDRNRIHTNLDLIFENSLSETEKTSFAKKVCHNLACSAIEAIRVRKMSSENIKSAIDDGNFPSIINRILASGKSVMLITGHYGNWELLATRLAQVAPLTVLARKNSNPHIEKAIHEMRQSNNITVLDRSDPKAPRKMIHMGRKGGHLLGVLMDQDTTRIKGIFSPFMNKTALTPRGPASIGIRNLYELFVIILRPIGNGQHKLFFEGPIEVPDQGDRETKIQLLTDRFNEILSRIIMEAPEFWVWNHRRWRHQPDKTEESLRS